MSDKEEILNNICYTELVYERINKKLRVALSKSEIEALLWDSINETDEKYFQRIGKNSYVTDAKHGIRITINSTTFRVITVDRI
jgi:hypothetical protein